MVADIVGFSRLTANDEDWTIRALGETARAKIEALIGSKVFLDLHVKIMPKWRRRAASLKRLGYTK